MSDLTFRLMILFTATLFSACSLNINQADIFVSSEARVPVSDVKLPASIERTFIQEINIKVEGRHFFGYRVAAKTPKRAVLFFTGNGYGAASALEHLTTVFHNDETDLYVVWYRLTDEAPPLVSQALAMGVALAQLASDTSSIPPSKIRVIGHSLGGWVAMNTASEAKVACVAVLGTGTTAKETAVHVLPWLVSTLFHIKANDDVALLNNPKRAQYVKIPLLVIGSEADEMMPPKTAEAIYQKAANPATAQLFISKTSTHNNYLSDAGVLTRLSSFLAERCEP